MPQCFDLNRQPSPPLLVRMRLDYRSVSANSRKRHGQSRMASKPHKVFFSQRSPTKSTQPEKGAEPDAESAAPIRQTPAAQALGHLLNPMFAARRSGEECHRWRVAPAPERCLPRPGAQRRAAVLPSIRRIAWAREMLYSKGWG